MTDATRNLLEQHFDTAFAAPDGVARLRELILTLAMQGKLVKQDPNDPPASELLKEIEAEKQRLVKAGKIKQPKPLLTIKPDELPDELPQGWEWVRMGDIGIWKSGSTPSRSNASFYGGDIPWVKSGEVKQGRIKFTEETITQMALDKCPLQINGKGSVLVAMYGANIGEVGILEIEAATNQAVCACKTYTSFDENYLLYLITSLKPYFISQGAGAAQPNISREKIVATIFPLPPLPEQHRIVARIDQLMARCDALEKLRKEREEKRLAVHAAAIKQLLDEPDGTAWGFIQQHFGELYSVKENVAELRKAILQLAVMGRLVPQEPNDPPASELLEEIEAEKQRLVKAGKIKKPKPLPEVSDEEVTHEIPTSWAWVRFGDIAQHNSGKTLDKGRNTGEPRDYITTSNLYWGRFELDNVRQMLIRDHELEKCTARKNDLLICEGGEAGRAAVWHFDSEVCFQNHVHRARFYRDIDPYFAYRFFEKLNATGEINQHRKGVGISNMSSKALASIVFPLPPLPEQHRIVARIDQLMALCDTLDQRIDAATGKQSELLNAVMAQV